MNEREALAFVERDARAIAAMGDAIVRLAQRLRERATVEELADSPVSPEGATASLGSGAEGTGSIPVGGTHTTDPAPSAEYLLGYSSAVLRAARNRAEAAYRAVMDDCADTREAQHHAMDAVWPIQRSPKTRDALDRWTLEAQKEADEWSGMQKPVKLTKPDGLMHVEPSNDPRTLGERLKGGE